MSHNEWTGPFPKDVFIVRFGNDKEEINAMTTMGRLGKVLRLASGDHFINGEQLEELKRLNIPHEIVEPPRSYTEVELVTVHHFLNKYVFSPY